MTSINLDGVNLNKVETFENKIVNVPTNDQANIKETSSIGSDNSNSVTNTKGNVPASGLSFGQSDNSIQATINSINTLLQGYDKKDIQNILKNIEKIDFSKGLDNIDDNGLLALAQLNLDLNSKRGVVTITDANGNVINDNQINELINSIKTTLKRSVASTSNTNSTDIKVESNPNIDKELVNTLNNTINEHKKAMEYNDTVVEPLNNELKSNIEKFEALSNQAKQISAKVDKGISEILLLKNQATSIIDNSVSRSLTEIEKKQLKSIEQTINIKQQQLIKDSELSESLMGDINSVFSSFEGSLNETEKNTMSNMKSALEKKVSGQALTVRENFLAGVSEEIYRLTSNMSESELNNVMNNQDLRVKMLSNNNKLIDKMMYAKTISDFSGSELEEISKKFKIKIVQEGNNISLLYTDSNGKEAKVNKDELRQMKTDLNNIVTSPELFTVARATGQISIAYSKDNPNQNENITYKSPDTKMENEEKNTSVYKDINSKSNTEGSKNANIDRPNKIYSEVEITKSTKSLEQTFLQKSLEKKEEQEKYHLKEIEKIHERRREINKELENKRIQEKYGN